MWRPKGGHVARPARVAPLGKVPDIACEPLLVRTRDMASEHTRLIQSIPKASMGLRRKQGRRLDAIEA